jgi:hypothetical protein
MVGLCGWQPVSLTPRINPTGAVVQGVHAGFSYVFNRELPIPLGHASA